LVGCAPLAEWFVLRPGHEPTELEPTARATSPSRLEPKVRQARARDMPRPTQAVNSRGYPGVVAGAIELDIEAVPTSRHLTVRNNSREFNILRKYIT
jgi:hypothetical protein